MSRYYCPFCRTSDKFHKIRNDGVLICVQCGDKLIKKRIINLRQIIGLFVASAFLTPLLILIIFVINDFSEETQPINYQSSFKMKNEK